MSADFFATFFDFTAVVFVFVFMMSYAIRQLPKAIAWYYKSKVEIARIKFEAQNSIASYETVGNDIEHERLRGK